MLQKIEIDYIVNKATTNYAMQYLIVQCSPCICIILFQSEWLMQSLKSK